MLVLARLILAASLLAAVPGHAADPGRPVVVELFTSQGCSSCPPAEALLGELARRDDVLPLAFHVDYWDRLGWKDPFSSADATRRQRDYAAKLGLRTVYTPQMVIDGRADVVGAYRDQVLRAIERARAARAAVPLRAALTDAGLAIEVGADAAAAPARLVLVGFDRHHVTRIGAGENGGRTLSEHHVVRRVSPLADWTGAPLSLTVSAQDLAGAERIALLLQQPDGTMLGAAVVR